MYCAVMDEIRGVDCVYVGYSPSREFRPAGPLLLNSMLNMPLADITDAFVAPATTDLAVTFDHSTHT